MRIGIHQPNFLPWMGYFYKIAQCDTFVLLDHVEFTKKSYTKRVKIHKSKNLEADQYLTVPLQKHSDHASIHSLKLMENEKWQKKTRNQIYDTYHKSPYYHQIEPLVDRFFNQPQMSDSFSNFNIEIIKCVAELLELKPQWILSSELGIEYSGIDINLEIVKHLGGHTYISGMGAKKYQDEDSFINNKIELQYSDFPSYFQTLDIPDHFLNKSIISYLAYYELEHLKTIIKI